MLLAMVRNDMQELTKIMDGIPPEDMSDPCVIFAFQVQETLAKGDWQRFFEMLAVAPLQTGDVMQFMADRVRDQVLKMMASCFRPYIAISIIHQQLGFPSEDEARNYVVSRHGMFKDEAAQQVDTENMLKGLKQYEEEAAYAMKVGGLNTVL